MARLDPTASPLPCMCTKERHFRLKIFFHYIKIGTNTRISIDFKHHVLIETLVVVGVQMLIL